MDLIAKHNAMQGARIASHFTNSNVELVEKSISDELEKGKKANLGEIREWGGEKYKKQVDGWVRVSDGQKRQKVEEGDVDKQDAETVAKEKKGGAEKNKGLGIFNDSHLFESVRMEHTTETLTNKVKQIIANDNLSKPDKVVAMFQEGLHIHEIVNVSGTPLSATIDYVKKAQKDGKFGNAQPKQSSSSSNDEGKTNESDSRNSVPLNLEGMGVAEITLDERWDAYKALATRVALGRSRAMIAYGSGGVGKTYTLLDPESGLFSRFKLRKGNIRANEETVDESGNVVDSNETGEDSIVGYNPQTGERFLKKDKYDYITVTGKVSPTRMFELMQEHNGKCIVFDDCDSVLKSEDAVNVLKGALDTSGDGTISWESKGTIKSGYAGIKGAKAVLNKKGNPTGVYDLPKTFKFTGQVVFISNLKNKEMPQALKSRSDRVDLTMTKEETIEKVKQIAPHAKLKTPSGDIIYVSKENREKAANFMEKYINLLSDDDLNMRTFLKIADQYQVAEEIGSRTDPERTMLASLVERKL